MVRVGTAKDGAGKWRLRCYAGQLPSGKSRYKERRFTGTPKEAAAALAQLTASVQLPSDGDPTVDELVEGWIVRSEPTWAADTGRRARRRWEMHASPHVGQIAVSRLTPRDLALAYQAMMASGLSPASVHRVHAIVHAALHEAVRWGLISHNPATGARPSVGRGKVNDPPPADAIARLLPLVHAANPEYGRWCELAAVTGARRAEVAGLRWTDVDFDLAHLRFVRTWNGREYAPTKNGDGRAITLDQRSLEMLREQKAEQVQRFEKLGVAFPEDGPLFADFKRGVWTAWRPDRVTKWWESRRAEFGVPDMRLHDFRHWAATQMLAGGVPMREVADHLGHRSTITTANVYGHRVAHGSLAADVLRKAMTAGA